MDLLYKKLQQIYSKSATNPQQIELEIVCKQCNTESLQKRQDIHTSRILNFGDCHAHTPSPISGKFDMCGWTYAVLSHVKFHPDWWSLGYTRRPMQTAVTVVLGQG